jgi:hypothetical protein
MLNLSEQRVRQLAVRWAADGLARKVGRAWLIDRAGVVMYRDNGQEISGMTFGKVERDSLGIPVNDTPSPVLRRIPQEEEKNAADASPNRGNPQGRSDRIPREEQARRDLEEHQRRLADEIDEAVTRTRPNPWLKPWDPGYESPTLITLRQATEAREPSRPVEAGAIARRMRARLAEIRRQNF